MLTTDGANQSVTGNASDKADNMSSFTVPGINIDTAKPTIIGAATTNPNGNGWYTGSVTIHFACNDALSGIVSCPADVMLSTDGLNQSITRSVTDRAGNTASATVSGINIDQTPPTITGAATTSPNGSNGWYTTALTVHFTCSDATSNIASCQPDVTLNTNGANQSITGTAKDQAGNTATFTVTGINIDRAAPTITSVNVANQVYVLSSPVPAPSCEATDANSGVASCSVSVIHDNNYGTGVGRFNYTASATDLAGNTATLTGYYTVIYKWDGFLQPINDTAHQTGLTTSVFKGGSSVPVKFQLKKADGTVVQAASLPQWLTPVKGSVMTAPVDESVYSDPATNGTTYRWDSTAQQYIYNWSTKNLAVGYYYRIGVTLDDGQTYYVNIGLR
jgi:hypothetical protein